MDDGIESLLIKLSSKAGWSENFQCVKDKITLTGEHKKLEKWSEKYWIQFWKDSFSFCSPQPEWPAIKWKNSSRLQCLGHTLVRILSHFLFRIAKIWINWEEFRGEQWE